MSASARGPALRRLGLVLVMAALAAGFNLAVSANAGAQDEADDLDPALVDQGGELFGSSCATCHGGEARGLTSEESPEAFGPSLLGVGAASVDFMVRTGRMPAVNANDPLIRRESDYTDTERAALVAYVQSLVPPEERGPDIPDVSGWQEADLSRGLELFTTNCAACHGPTAAGIAVGRDDVSSNLKNVAPVEIGESVRVGPGVMPVFGDEVVTDQDLDAIVAWVQDVTHRGSPGGVALGRGGPVSEGLIAWIVGLGVLGVVIYLLGEREGTEDITEEADDGPASATGGSNG